jgi:hypothetical protein
MTNEPFLEALSRSWLGDFLGASRILCPRKDASPSYRHLKTARELGLFCVILAVADGLKRHSAL